MKKPYYQESAQILALIKKSKRILINCHRSPDLDSVGSATALYQVLKKMGKKTTIICPTKVPVHFSYLKDAGLIRVVNFNSFPFAQYDLMLIADTQSLAQLTGRLEGTLPDVPIVLIDHHKTNGIQSLVRIVDKTRFSCAELVYRILKDCKVVITKEIATALFAGISGDTSFFKYVHYTDELLEVAAELLRKGADKDGLIRNVFNNFDHSLLKLLGYILEHLRFDIKNKIAWSVVDYRTYERFGKPAEAKNTAADLFFSSIRGCEFGIVVLEEEKDLVKLSIRSRWEFDCTRLAGKFGGGGHRTSAGALVKGDFKTVVASILREARKLSKELLK